MIQQYSPWVPGSVSHPLGGTETRGRPKLRGCATPQGRKEHQREAAPGHTCQVAAGWASSLSWCQALPRHLSFSLAPLCPLPSCVSQPPGTWWRVGRPGGTYWATGQTHDVSKPYIKGCRAGAGGRAFAGVASGSSMKLIFSALLSLLALGECRVLGASPTEWASWSLYPVRWVPLSLCTPRWVSWSLCPAGLGRSWSQHF